MPELSSSKQGDYVATPVVAQIADYDIKKLTLSPGEVASVFTGNVCVSFYHFYTNIYSSATGNPHRTKISWIHSIQEIVQIISNLILSKVKGKFVPFSHCTDLTI